MQRVWTSVDATSFLLGAGCCAAAIRLIDRVLFYSTLSLGANGQVAPQHIASFG
jgi:hypothetical protein